MFYKSFLPVKFSYSLRMRKLKIMIVTQLFEKPCSVFFQTVDMKATTMVRAEDLSEDLASSL